MSTSDLPFEGSKLFQRMRQAINEHAPFNGKLRVSVADEPKWEKSGSGDEILVRWACWNLEEGDKEVTQPEFEVLCDHETRERLARELRAFFPDVEVEVDNEIDM
jgi:hypothetical protein